MRTSTTPWPPLHWLQRFECQTLSTAHNPAPGPVPHHVTPRPRGCAEEPNNLNTRPTSNPAVPDTRGLSPSPRFAVISSHHALSSSPSSSTATLGCHGGLGSATYNVRDRCQTLRSVALPALSPMFRGPFRGRFMRVSNHVRASLTCTVSDSVAQALSFAEVCGCRRRWPSKAKLVRGGVAWERARVPALDRDEC